MYRIDRFVICVAVSIAEVFVVFELVGQLLWLAVRNRLEYGTLITVEEWGPIVLVWIPVGLGVVLAIGKFLYFKPEARSG